MQGMDKKYDGHAWCKLITTNIKNSFGLSFKKAFCLGHLRCVHDDCEDCIHLMQVICSTSRNETLWCGECVHILILGPMTMIPITSSFACKFYHAPAFYVVDCSGRIYYVLHRL
jgi:hypothetical protein